jgi:hypothetical protein
MPGEDEPFALARFPLDKSDEDSAEPRITAGA